MEAVKIIECPRDAWQALPRIVPTEVKVDYLRRLAAAGFRHMDAVSFVSPKHVPQTADSEAVMEAFAPQPGTSPPPEIIGIVVNEKGLGRALATPGVTTIGYPYSISAYFRRANANMSLAESRELVGKLRQAAAAASRGLVVYISMAFGNPYDEPWGPEMVQETLDWLREIGVRQVSLADTTGQADASLVGDLYRAAAPHAQGMDLGVHLHSRPEGAANKIFAAWDAGCRRFDSALTGLGGCPFAGDDLVGNIPTEVVLTALAERGAALDIHHDRLASAVELAREIRRLYA
jgi:hydroxymethylglutaryl-CoA lyase